MKSTWLYYMEHCDKSRSDINVEMPHISAILLNEFQTANGALDYAHLVRSVAERTNISQCEVVLHLRGELANLELRRIIKRVSDVNIKDVSSESWMLRETHVANEIQSNSIAALSFDKFITTCTACGGDWTRMIMTGIKAVAPGVWDDMPDRSYSFEEVCFIANHLCYDRPHFRFNRSIDGQIIEHTIDGKFLYRTATAEEMAMTAEEFHLKYNDPVTGHLEFQSSEVDPLSLG